MRIHVILVGIFQLVHGLLFAASGGFMLFGSEAVRAVLAAQRPDQWTPFFKFLTASLEVIGGSMLIYGCAVTFVAVGLLCLKPWARVITIVVNAVPLISGLGGVASIVGAIFAIIPLLGSVYTLWVLLSPETERLFSPPAGEPSPARN